MDNSTPANTSYTSHQIIRKITGRLPSSAAIYRKINELIREGTITRTGRNTYIFGNKNIKTYEFNYSDLSKDIVSMIDTNYQDVNFTVFETRQFNEFMNLQIAKNTIMVSVESGLENYIFRDFSEKYPGKVLLKPDKETLWTYLQEDSIIINKLPTEAPLSTSKKWITIPEKFLVDLVADKTLKSLITQSQIEYIYEGYLSHYQIDIKKMLRYARRRTCEDILKVYIEQYKKK